MLHVIWKLWRYRCHKLQQRLCVTRKFGLALSSDRKMHRSTSKQQRTFANIHLWKHCFPAFHNFFKYGSESSTGAKVKGHESCLWSERSTGAKVWSSVERKFLEHSLLRSEISRSANVPWNESSWTFRSPGANVPRNKSSTGAKVLSMDFSLPGTKVQRNEKARYPNPNPILNLTVTPNTNPNPK